MEQVLVLCLIDLQATLHQVEGNDEGVRGSARQNATDTAQGEVVERAEFASIAGQSVSGLDVAGRDELVLF
jgi:hypothetical protein